jgi:hypothetical protein
MSRTSFWFPAALAVADVTRSEGRDRRLVYVRFGDGKPALRQVHFPGTRPYLCIDVLESGVVYGVEAECDKDDGSTDHRAAAVGDGNQVSRPFWFETEAEAVLRYRLEDETLILMASFRVEGETSQHTQIGDSVAVETVDDDLVRSLTIRGRLRTVRGGLLQGEE